VGSYSHRTRCKVSRQQLPQVFGSAEGSPLWITVWFSRLVAACFTPWQPRDIVTFAAAAILAVVAAAAS
jgi:hypothetical protein